MPGGTKIAVAARALVTGAFLAGALLTSCGLRAQEPAEQVSETIVLGLLIEDSLLVEGRFGAEYAVKEINRKGGIDGIPLALSVKSMEGPWGVGSTQAVNLVFEQEALALVGLLNGRNSHLVEQVAAKTDVPFISAWAADPTLSKAYVPQFFNCAPNSEQQGRAILNELAEKQVSDKWFLVSDDGYDSRIAVQSLKNIDEYEKGPAFGLFKCNSTGDFEEMIKRIITKKPKALVVFCEPELTLELIRYLRGEGIRLPIYSNLSLLHEAVYSQLMSGSFQELYFMGTGDWMRDRNSDFVREFQDRYDRYPGAMAAYGYDAIRVLAKAIDNSNLDPKKLKQSLSKTSYKGKTGLIEFDRFGNRKKALESGVLQSGILFAPNP